MGKEGFGGLFRILGLKKEVLRKMFKVIDIKGWGKLN